MAYPLFLCCDVGNLLDTFQTNTLVVVEREVEQATYPPGKLRDIAARLAAGQANDSLEY